MAAFLSKFDAGIITQSLACHTRMLLDDGWELGNRKSGEEMVSVQHVGNFEAQPMQTGCASVVF